eukprot:scaffold136981_cov139-Phaeocystis_antarctica.AAC.2
MVLDQVARRAQQVQRRVVHLAPVRTDVHVTDPVERCSAQRLHLCALQVGPQHIQLGEPPRRHQTRHAGASALGGETLVRLTVPPRGDLFRRVANHAARPRGSSRISLGGAQAVASKVMLPRLQVAP